MAKKRDQKNIKFIYSEKTSKAIKLGEDIKSVQNYEAEQINKPLEKITIKEVLNSVGISISNSAMLLVLSCIKIVLLTVFNSGAFIVGEQGTGKSALYTLFFKDLISKISGNVSLAMLRGDARSSEENYKCLLEENTVIFEEIMEEQITKDIVGLMKDSIESGFFLKKGKISTSTNTSFIFIGNNYSFFKNFREINHQSILKDIPKAFYDRAFFDRIPFILPHYHFLLGEVEYIGKNELIIPIVYLENILKNIREIPVEFIIDEYSHNFSSRELKFYNFFIFRLFCLFYPEVTSNNIPNWFIKGWIEFLKYFRGLLTKQYHNPFNHNSTKLILYLYGYNFNEIEYVAFDNEDRLIIKLLNKEVFHKIALTGFGIESNKIEMNYLKSNPNSDILSIINLLNNDTLLIQESGEYLFDNRIYLNNIREQNNSFNKTDDEYNELILEKLAKGENGVSFRGIPKFYKKGLLLRVQNIFGKDVETIELEDFCFEKTEIKILNFAKYLKKI